MAGEDEGAEDKTEQATQKHVEQARDAGNVPVSREATALASLGAVIVILSYQLPGMAQHAVPILRGFVSRAGDRALVGVASFWLAAGGLADFVVPTLLAAAAAGSVAVLLQTNFLVHLGALEPKMSRVNPVAGFKRIFGASGYVEFVKSIGKLSIVAVVIWMTIASDLPGFLRLPFQSPHSLLAIVLRLSYKILIAGLSVQAAVAAIDLGWVRFQYARKLRMSKQSIRDEAKDTEGNPQVKAKIRRIGIMRARKRMMSKVPTATVVITNPTHYAVALLYDRTVNPAPRIVAKGVDEVAARIREVAQFHNVPMVANAPLARALYRLELDAEIPAEHYKAVAQVIAFVWGLRRSSARI